MTTVSKQYSSFWLDDDMFDDDEIEKSGTDLHRIARLAAVRRAVSNFVTILTGKSIKVIYSSGKTSKTDGETVIISAEEDSTKFDVMVGLALHEGSHVLLTDFEFLKSLVHVRAQVRNQNVPHMWITPANQYMCRPVDKNDPMDNVVDYIFHPYVREMIGPRPDNGAEWQADFTGVMHRNYGNYGSPQTYYDSKYWGKITRAMDDISFIMNIIEDRRIDQYVYRNAGGYRPYYDALYAKYFFTREVGKNLRFNPAWRTITIENYITRLLYAFHPDASVTAMPGLRKLMKILDIQNIDRIAPENDPMELKTLPDESVLAVPQWYNDAPTYDKLPVIWKVANELYAQILKYCDLAAQQQVPMPNFEQMENDGKSDKKASNMPNLDGGMPSAGTEGEEQENDDAKSADSEDTEDMSERPVEKDVKGKGKKQKEVDGKFNVKKAEKERKEAEKLMKGEIKKKKVKATENTAIDALEQADAQMVDIKGEGIPYGRTMVTRRMSDSLMAQDWFIFKRWAWKDGVASQFAEKSVAAGRRMGAILHHRLQVRNDPIITKQTRLQEGGLDRRLLANLGMDITSVFQKSRTDVHRPVMLHLTLDASGSMIGNKWEKVRTVAVALAYIGSKLRNVDTVISIRGGNDMPLVAVVFDSRRDHFNRFLRYIKLIEPNGGTPEGMCYKATMDLILETKDTHDVYFINFSDGQPLFHLRDAGAPGAGRRRRLSYYYGGGFSYAGETAFKHTRQMMQMLRDNGVKILSYFISEDGWRYGASEVDKKAFRQMYGENAEYVNVENAGEVLRTLNKLLLARG